MCDKLLFKKLKTLHQIALLHYIREQPNSEIGLHKTLKINTMVTIY